MAEIAWTIAELDRELHALEEGAPAADPDLHLKAYLSLHQQGGFAQVQPDSLPDADYMQPFSAGVVHSRLECTVQTGGNGMGTVDEGLTWQIGVWDQMAPVYIREVDKRFVPVVEHLIATR